MGDLGPSRAAVNLGELHEAADLAGAVGVVAMDRDALLPAGADDPHRDLGAAHALLIQGSIRVHHRSATRDHEETQINEALSERLFCSEDEAKAAGWRAPRG